MDTRHVVAYALILFLILFMGGGLLYATRARRSVRRDQKSAQKSRKRDRKARIREERTA
jgi:hypothetical protein